MANNRKIQGEIDKLLKKIQEGMEIYDEISEKVANANEKSLKERIEGDLKSQIKKLQRCRDSVKQYVANPEVKDKRALEEARRAIERKMEAFKVTERETKTKAFSKEGLIAAARDPNDPKSLTSVWLREFISELKEKIEQLEFDVENEAVSGAAAAKKGKGKTEDPEERLERARHHVFRLEQLLRLLNRDELEAQDIDDIRDSVTEFVENVLDMNYEEVDTELYDVFGLPDEAEDDSDDDDSDNSDDSDSDDEEAASRKAANKQKPAATTAPSTLPSAPAVTSGGGKVVSSPTMSRQGSSAVSDEKKPATPATPASTAKQAPTPTSGATTGKKQPPPALPATSTSAAAIAPSPSNVATGKKQQTPLSSTAAKQTPNSPNKNSFGNNQFNSEPLSHEGSKDNFATMSSEQFGGGNNNNNNNNNDDGLGDDDDAFNDDTFGDDAMNAVDSGATLGDLSAMSANNNKGGKQTAMTAPANVWAAKKPVGGIAAASTNSSGASSTSGSNNNNNANATAALPSGGPTLDSLSAFGGGSSKTPTTAAGTGAGVKSAWSQPLSSLGGVGPKLDAKSPSLAEMFGAAAAASTQPGSKDASFQPTPSKNVAPSNNNNNNNNNTMTMNSSNVPPDPAIIAAVPVSNNNNNNGNKQNQNQLQQQQDQQQQQQSTSSSIPTSVSGAAATSTATATPSVTLTAASTMRMLDMSVRNLPHASDVERLKPYVPANPQPTPNYYPQKVPACFSDPTLFQKFEPDTLFFIFYYQQGSYQHYLAAKELKRNSYRFHKKFTTWFQRHDRPKSLNEEQEQGTYVYFDFESGWCQRIKNDFSFRYTYLENELV